MEITVESSGRATVRDGSLTEGEIHSLVAALEATGAGGADRLDLLLVRVEAVDDPAWDAILKANDWRLRNRLEPIKITVVGAPSLAAELCDRAASPEVRIHVVDVDAG